MSAAPGRRPVVAAVSYLNARPLIAGLDERFEVVERAPAECWELVRSGRADLGLIPSLGLGDEPGLAIARGIAIASEGPVRSVILLTRGPLAAVRSVAVDRSSRASVALLRILLARRFDVAPRFAAMAPDWEAMLAEHDAALLIGDPALALAGDPRFYEHRNLQVLDIGEEWTKWTGLPFVFAVWAGRAERLTPEIVAELDAARDRGIASLDEIARAAAPAGDGAAAERNRRYLEEVIRYRLGPREIAGLLRFLELAAEHRLLAGGRPAPAALSLTGGGVRAGVEA